MMQCGELSVKNEHKEEGIDTMEFHTFTIQSGLVNIK